MHSLVWMLKRVMKLLNGSKNMWLVRNVQVLWELSVASVVCSTFQKQVSKLSLIHIYVYKRQDKTIPSLDFFETYTAEDFAQYKAEQGLAMEVDDLLFIQDYFKSIGRVPTETELKVLDLSLIHI